MKSLKQNLHTFLQNMLLLPPNNMNQPSITIKGEEQFIIENEYRLHYVHHDTLCIHYDNEEKAIEIIGVNLVIKAMYKEELVIEGKFTEIKFKSGRK